MDCLENRLKEVYKTRDKYKLVYYLNSDKVGFYEWDDLDGCDTVDKVNSLIDKWSIEEVNKETTEEKIARLEKELEDAKSSLKLFIGGKEVSVLNNQGAFKTNAIVIGDSIMPPSTLTSLLESDSISDTYGFPYNATVKHIQLSGGMLLSIREIKQIVDYYEKNKGN